MAATYRLFPSGDGPALVADPDTPFLAGTKFGVSQGGMWFGGYWWWVPPAGDTSPQLFALWNVISATPTGVLVPGSVILSGELTAGQWNFVPAAAPVPVAIGATYIAATGWQTAAGFPDANNQFSSGGPFAGGIVNGPLVAWSDGTAGGTNNGLYPGVQGLFSASLGTDPSAAMPNQGSDSSYFGLDVEVSDTAPADYTGPFSATPNQFDATGAMTDLGRNYILGTRVSWPAVELMAIRYFSPAAATQLATDALLWDAATQQPVPGTHLVSPAWSGAAGSGWVQADYPSPVPIADGDYLISIANLDPTPGPFNATTIGYFVAGGPGAAGIMSGPITVPAAADASPGQCVFQDTTGAPALVFPTLYVADEGQQYWLDVVVNLAGGGASYPVWNHPWWGHEGG